MSVRPAATADITTNGSRVRRAAGSWGHALERREVREPVWETDTVNRLRAEWRKVGGTYLNGRGERI